MNEKVKELFKRAGGKTSIHNLMSNPMQQREYSELWDDNIQKFAELIVRECADIALKSGNIANKNIAAKIESERIYHKIKEHFGVKE